MKPNSIQRDINEDGHDTNCSDPGPGKPHPKQSHPTVVKGVRLELSGNSGERLPMPFAEDLPQQLGKGRKQGIIKAAPVEEIDTDLPQEAEEPEQMKSTSNKRASPPEAHGKDAGGDIHNRSVRTSRKRPKAARRNNSKPEGKTIVVKKIRTSGQASEKLVENSDKVTSLTDESRKRPREPGHEDTLADAIVEKPRKRMKTALPRDKPIPAADKEKAIDASSRIIHREGENPRKT